MKIPAYLSLAVATILLGSALVSVWNNVVHLQYAQQALNDLSIEMNTGIKQSEPLFSWQQQDAILAVVGSGFLIAGLAMLRKDSTVEAD